MSTGITMTDAITALVEQKRAVGYKYAAEARVLARFAAFCRSEFPGLQAPDQASADCGGVPQPGCTGIVTARYGQQADVPS